MLKKLVTALALAAVCFAAGGSMRLHGGPSFTPAWQVFKIGAGGQLTGIHSYSDGTLLARMDTLGGYIYNTTGSCTYGGTVYAAPCWQELATATSIPSFSTSYTNGDGGVREVVAAPSNTNDLYMLWEYKFWVSANRGASWTAVAGVANGRSPNDGNAANPQIAVDPNDPTTVFVATTNGISKVTNALSGSPTVAPVFGNTGAITYQQGSSTHLLIAPRTLNSFGGTSGSSTTLTLDSSPSTGSNGSYVTYPPCTGTGALITGTGITAGTTVSAYDGNVTITLSAAMTVAAHTQVTFFCPLYESTNASTFAVTSSSPTFQNPVLWADKFGTFWVCEGSGNNAYAYVNSGGGWVTRNTGRQAAGVTTNPASSAQGTNQVIVTDNLGVLTVSNDNGATWTVGGNLTFSADAADPPWLGNAFQSTPPQLNTYSIAADPSGNVWLAGGIGAWRVAAASTFPTPAYVSHSLGIEQLVVTSVVTPPGGSPIASVWDRGFFTQHNPDVFPSTYYLNSSATGTPILFGWGVDYATSDSTFVAGWIVDLSGTERGASSTDGGNTFSAWTTQPPAVGARGGWFAAASSTHWLLLSQINDHLQYTLNGASSAWLTSTIAGTPTNWAGNPGVGVPFAADRVAADTYCAITAAKTVYYSTNGGANFTASGLTSANIDGNPNAFMLRAAPFGVNSSSAYFYLAGDGGNGTSHLWKLTKTTNPCDTATSVSSASLTGAFAVGFGAIKAGASFQTVYAYAFWNGTLEFVQSTDGGSTFAPISAPADQLNWPLNSVDLVVWTDGDPDIYGRINVGFRGSGPTYIDTADACPFVNWTSTNPNASLTGTVTLTAQHSGRVPVSGVNFYVDGVQIGATQTGQTSYSVSWNTGGVANGAHTLKVQAAGNGCFLGGTGNAKSIPVTTH